VTAALRLEAHGLGVDLPRGWEGRLYVRPLPGTTGDTHPAAAGHPGEVPNPVLHLANFALPHERGDFGTGAVERMRPGHVFVSLFEYDPAEAHRPLFAARGLPLPRVGEFAPNALQRLIRGQGGWQRFFTASDRAFCLYVVLGALARERDGVAEVRQVLRAVTVGRR
jgi:hypothetical protein